jgi:hypothetical protein
MGIGIARMMSSGWFKNSIIVLLISGLPTSSEAQSISVGPRAGLSAAGVLYRDASTFSNTQPRVGGHVGAAAALAASRFLEFEAALLYTQGGFQGRGGHPANLRTDNLTLPLAVRLRLASTVSPHLTLGVAGRLQLRCRLTNVAFVGETTCDDPVVGTSWQPVELLGRGGLGVSFPVRRGRVLLDAFVAMGLGDIKKSTLPPGWARSITIQISLAYLVPLRQS